MANSEFSRWLADKGKDTLRLNYNLTRDSVVFDAGGYRGDFAAKISQLYNCEIHIFEPIASYSTSIQERFKGNERIFVHQFGLSSKNNTVQIALRDDASSTHTPMSGITEMIALRDIFDVIAELKVENIDLIKINIEGEEYALLEHCIKTGVIKKMTDIQVQFHSFITNAHEKRDNIREKLMNTHELTYDYAFIWENWKIRDQNLNE